MGSIYSGSNIIILYEISYYGSNIFGIKYNYFIYDILLWVQYILDQV